VPVIRPARPFISSSPYSSELVLDRRAWPEVSTKYLLLPVHVSLAFLQTPVWSLAAIPAWLLYAAPSHWVCTISGRRQ
jgi:hypothetical protein